MRKSLAGCISIGSCRRLYRPGRRLRHAALFRHLRASPRSCCGPPFCPRCSPGPEQDRSATHRPPHRRVARAEGCRSAPDTSINVHSLHGDGGGEGVNQHRDSVTSIGVLVRCRCERRRS